MSITLRPILRPSAPLSVFQSSRSGIFICQSCRNARLLRRPKRPYTFTQLVTLSDGSAFTVRTTSPQPVYRSTRDTRNAILWNPSSKELLNVEADEAGRLAGFRARFGRSFDSEKETTATSDSETPSSQDAAQTPSTGKGVELDNSGFGQEEDANLLELISSYGQAEDARGRKKHGGK
jgi:hypothetical protein